MRVVERTINYLKLAGRQLNWISYFRGGATVAMAERTVPSGCSSRRTRGSEVSIRRRLNEDLYLNFAGTANDQKKFVLQAYVFPLVSWIWLGYWVVLFGTIVCLIPAKVQRQALMFEQKLFGEGRERPVRELDLGRLGGALQPCHHGR